MNSLTVHLTADGVFKLTGDLTFASINKKTVGLCDFTKIHGTIIMDFSAVNHADSAGLALLIEWLKLAQASQRTLQFNHIPPQLLTLAQLSGFDKQPHFAIAQAVDN
jgi:phospholipid transport system transporter-binding protein